MSEINHPTPAQRYSAAVIRIRRARGLPSHGFNVLIPDINDYSLLRLAEHAEEEATMLEAIQ